MRAPTPSKPEKNLLILQIVYRSLVVNARRLLIKEAPKKVVGNDV